MPVCGIAMFVFSLGVFAVRASLPPAILLSEYHVFENVFGRLLLWILL